MSECHLHRLTSLQGRVCGSLPCRRAGRHLRLLLPGPGHGLQQGGQLTHVLTQAIAHLADIDIGADHAGGDDDDQLGAHALCVGAAEEVPEDGDFVQPGHTALALAGGFLDQAAHDDGFARAHGHAAGDLALQEAALLGDLVLGTDVGDGLVDRHGDDVAGVDGRCDLQAHAGVFVLQVAGDELAVAVHGLPCLKGLLGADVDGSGMVVQHHQGRAGHDLEVGLAGQGIEHGTHVASGVAHGVGEAGQRIAHATPIVAVVALGAEQAAAAGAPAAATAAAERPFQAVAQAVVEGDFDDAGLDQHLGGGHVQALEGGLDAFVLGPGAPDEHGVVQLIGHDANAAQVGDVAHAAADRLAGIAQTAGTQAASQPCAQAQAAAPKGVAAGVGVVLCDAAGAAGGAAQTGGHATVAAAGGGAAPEDAGQHGGQVLGVAVLHVVDVQLRLAAGAAGLVELGHPAPDLFQIGGVRGDDEQAVEALNGQDVQGASQWRGPKAAAQRCRSWSGRPTCLAAGDGGARHCRSGCATTAAAEQLQGGAGFFDAEVFEREEPDGHALQQIDVEGAHHVQPAFGLGAGAAHDEQVAHAVHAQDGAVVRHGPQDGGHFLRADVLQGDDDGAIARRHGGATVGHAHGSAQAAQGIDAANVEDAACVAHHGQAVGLQGDFHEVDGLVGADGLFGGQGDVAANGRMQHVVHVQDVAQHGAHQLGNGHVFQIEGNGLARLPLVGFGGSDALTVADDGAHAVVFGLCLVGIGAACTALGLGGFGQFVGVGAEVADELGFQRGTGHQGLADGQGNEGSGQG